MNTRIDNSIVAWGISTKKNTYYINYRLNGNINNGILLQD